MFKPIQNAMLTLLNSKHLAISPNVDHLSVNNLYYLEAHFRPEPYLYFRG